MSGNAVGATNKGAQFLPANDDLIRNCEIDANSGEPMAWQNATVLQLLARIRQEQAKLAAVREVTKHWDHGEGCPFHLCDYDDDGNPITYYDGRALQDSDCDCGIAELEAALAGRTEGPRVAHSE